MENQPPNFHRPTETNAFGQPDAQQTAAPSYTAAPKGRYFFKDSSFKTQAVQTLLYFSILVWIIAVCSDFLEYRLLNDFTQGTFTSEQEMKIAADGNDTRQSILGLMQMALAITTFVFFMMWVYRANHNTRALTDESLEITPGWSVGWFFVPIACLWKPYEALKEIWQTSASHCRQNVSGSSLVGFWWMFWLVSSVLSQVVLRLQMHAEELDEMVRVSVITMVSDSVDIISKILTLFLIFKIASMHNQILAEKTSGTS